ncbi:MAG: retron system putative HNH endonuclease [Sarcina sp.]
MLFIKKSSPPKLLIQYKKDKFASYAECDTIVKNEIKKQLLEEQGYLCAYCMKKIKFENMKIEHYKPQSIDPKEELNYSNMLAVCKGNEGNEFEGLTCDSYKGNESITVNPLDNISIDKIIYKDDGTIYSKDSFIDSDLNNTLNLNCNAANLKINRRNVLKLAKVQMYKNKQKGDWSKAYLEKEYKAWNESKEDGSKREYSGIVLKYIKNRIRKL